MWYGLERQRSAEYKFELAVERLARSVDNENITEH